MFTFAEIIGKDKIEKLKLEHDKEIIIAGKHLEKAEDLEDDIVNSVFKEYNSKEERDELIKRAKAFNFSKEKLEHIERVFEDYNQDNVNYNVALDIIEARKHIKEHSKESFFSTISNIVINEDD